MKAYGYTAVVGLPAHDYGRFVAKRKAQNPTVLLPQRINNRQKRKPIKIGVAGANLTDATFAHQDRGVEVVQKVVS